MPKDRRYTRKELESLRRADLQSIFKSQGLKGANQSTKAMIDALITFFESSYISPSRRQNKIETVRKVRPVPNLGKSLKSAKDVKMSMVPARNVQVDEALSIRPAVQEIRTDQVVLGEGTVIGLAQRKADPPGPSQSRSPIVMAPPALPSSTPKSSPISQARVQEMLNARDKIWEARLRALEEVFEERVKELEKKVEETIRSLSVAITPSNINPQFTLTAGTPTSVVLGKRTERDSLTQTPGAGPSRTSSPITKRARIETTEEEDSDAFLPHTPSPPRASTVPRTPRTPSPGHQGMHTDNSRTPGVGSDFLPPSFSHQKRFPEDEEVSGLYPVFATTPKPSAPRSPTLDAPPSANRHRLNFYPGAALTTGRRVPSPAPRSVSEAHKELTTITESDEPSIPVSIARRRVASENTPTRLIASTLRGSSVPISPPQLSPSPSIGAVDRDGGFSYTPLPAVPRASTLKSTIIASRSPQTAKRGETHRSISPLNYMDVAMHGMEGVEDGIGNMATPHRTMLGTERYRDTRFGDVPMVSWGSPSIDLGPNTPATYPRREW